jgi:hypothetical protein
LVIGNPYQDLCVIAAEAFTFVRSDHRLLEAARSEQLKVLDPVA